MEKENKLTDDEIAEISKLNAEYQNLVFEIGEISLKQTQLRKESELLDADQKELMSTFDLMKQKESDFVGRLESKYGVGRLDAPHGKYINY